MPLCRTIEESISVWYRYLYCEFEHIKKKKKMEKTFCTLREARPLLWKQQQKKSKWFSRLFMWNNHLYKMESEVTLSSRFKPNVFSWSSNNTRPRLFLNRLQPHKEELSCSGTEDKVLDISVHRHLHETEHCKLTVLFFFLNKTHSWPWTPAEVEINSGKTPLLSLCLSSGCPHHTRGKSD